MDAVSTRGVMTLSWTLDHVGPMCRTVEDVAMMLNAIARLRPAGADHGSRSRPRLRAGNGPVDRTPAYRRASKSVLGKPRCRSRAGGQRRARFDDRADVGYGHGSRTAVIGESRDNLGSGSLRLPHSVDRDDTGTLPIRYPSHPRERRGCPGGGICGGPARGGPSAAADSCRVRRLSPPFSRVFVAKSRRRRQSKARARRAPEAYLTVRRGARPRLIRRDRREEHA